MLKYFEEMFSEVREYIWTRGYKKIQIVQTNPVRKDVSTEFDMESEDIIIDYCKRKGLPVKILTEERGTVDIASGTPEYILIADPTDGSTNLKKGIEGSAVCLAALPYRSDGTIKPSDVQYALIGSLVSGSLCKGEKEKGTFYKGIFSGNEEIPVHGSKCRDLGNACLEIDLDFNLDETTSGVDGSGPSKIARILTLVHPNRRIKHIRRNGAAGMGLMGVATGAVDAYIDARDISTPENWMGAQLLIREGGGMFTDLYGNDNESFESLDKPYSYITAGNEHLHGQILMALGDV